MEAVTIQILRNKIASLVEEMHYHFYRSGYSTIIRESRDFSCVILDRDGRLIVAPPMFFHAPVYRHLVARILALYGAPTLLSASAGQPHVSAPLLPLPAQRGEGRGEGLFPQAQTRGEVPSPGLSPQAGRGEGAMGGDIREGDVFVSN